MVDSAKQARGTWHVLGAMALVAVGLAFVAAIALGILESRSRYFEERNLRELDRIAAELNATSESLAEVATLHFVPQQLHFSLSQSLECLAATTVIRGARQRPMTISYYFTDPAATNDIARWYASRSSRLPAADSDAIPDIDGEDLPPGICGYRRPLAADPRPKVEIGGGVLAVERTARLSALLWPMTSQQMPTDFSACGSAPDGGAGGGAGEEEAYIRRCFRLAAIEDLRDQTFSHRGRDAHSDIVAQSIEAAFESNAIRINVSTPMQAVGLDPALDMFDAVQIIGSDAGPPARPRLLYQAGRVPPAVQGEDRVDRGLFASLLGTGAAAPQNRPPERRSSAEPARPFMIDSEVDRRSDVILFQRTVDGLAGMDCHPCRIVGIVERARFDQTVRKIDGVHATMFLIGVLTLIGIIPLVQLKLRRRLDATRRTGQYLLWFSLTLLAASAVVAALAIWSSAASRQAGSRYAAEAAETISRQFATELAASLQLVRGISAELEAREPGFPAPAFPAPQTLPSAEMVAAGTPPPGFRALRRAWETGSEAGIFETVSFFRSDGFIDRERPRLATGRLPAFGTTIARRHYFARARNCDYDRLGRTGDAFILDRVFARPDGAPRVIWLLPTQWSCNLSALRETPGEPDTPVKEELFRDPSQSAFVLASGSLRTFMRAELAPGFDYAVIDLERPGGEANVMFHSRPGAELVERFQTEIDNPEAFAAAARELRTAAPGLHAEGDRQVWDHAVRIDTNYRGRPARLTVSRLHDDMDWLLVLIEDRNDAGYAIWRAASFGYGVWFIGVLVMGAVVLANHLRRSQGLDRRPVLWLWPQGRLGNFTPPRTRRHEDMREWLRAAAAARDRHIWVALLAGLFGVTAGEAGSRVVFAFAVALAVLAARAYFRGLTSIDDRSARRQDRMVVVAAAALTLLSAIPLVFGLIDEYRFGALRSAGAGPALLLVAGRALIFAGAAVLVLALLREAWPHSAPEPERVKVAEVRGRTRRWDNGWMVALLVLGGLPAFAGFLDSHDHDRRLVVERQAHLHIEAEAARRQAATSLINARIAPLPDPLVQEIVRNPLVPPPRSLVERVLEEQVALPARGLLRERIDAPGAGVSGAAGWQPERSCLAASCLAIRYLGLREQALEYSDFAPFQMRDALGRFAGGARLAALLLLVALPFAMLWLVISLFRHQYFREPPSLSPGKDPEFDPPLSDDRRGFVRDALAQAASGRTPRLKFAPAGGNLHLMLGAGLDLRDDRLEGPRGRDPKTGAELAPRRLGQVEGIAWVDLLDEDEAEVPENAHAVVIGNLDLALQAPDSDTVERAYARIKALVGTAGHRRHGERHVFLLAEIDPLDRIALLWNRDADREEREGARRLEAWRWGELIQDFTLFPLLAGAPVECAADETRVLRAIREELGVLDTSFAHELRDQLLVRFGEGATGEAGGRILSEEDHEKERVDEERIIAFITEQMSDHYHKLWASSGTEEQVILFKVAGDCHMKMSDSLALRALLARGLLIRVPEYRLMNRSFARYVRRVGAPSEIQRSAQALGGIDRVWPLIRYPLAAIAGSAVLLLQFVAPASGSAAVGALPALLALVPALLGRWLQDRAIAS